MPQPVLAAIQNHLRLEAEIGGYEAAEQEEASIERAYRSAARLIGAHPDEIAIVENATRAWDMAFYSIPLRPGDRILTAAAEYASNYIAYLQRAKATGAIIEVIPDDEHGQTSVAALDRMLASRERVKLIAVTHVPTNGGLVNPASQIGKIARVGRRALPAGRLPVDRPDADGRRRGRLRPALGDREEIPARPAGDRLSICPPGPDRTAGTAFPGSSRRGVGRPRPVRNPAGCPPGSRTGKRIWRRKSAWAPRWITPRSGVSTSPGSASRRWRKCCAEGRCSACLGFPSATWERCAAGSSLSRLLAGIRRKFKQRLGALGINVSVSTVFDPIGYGKARPHKPGARFCALLQQRRGKVERFCEAFGEALN